LLTEYLIRTFVRDYTNTDEAAVRTSYGKLAGVVAIAANCLLFIGKILAALVCGSVAIAADAVNNLSDASSGVISLLGFRMAAKPADEEHPWGHARYEYLSGLLISGLILLIGLEMLKSGVQKIFHPDPAAFSVLAAGILAASILVKLWLSVFNRRLGTLIGSPALIASAADSRNDVISTAAVLAAMLITHFTKVDLDGFMGAAVALFILYSGVGLVRETVSPLLGRAPDSAAVAAIRDRILAYPGVLGMHDLMIHDYGPGRQFASVHVEMAAETNILESHDVIDNIERDFLRRDGVHMIVHLDPIITADPHVNELRAFLTAEIQQIDPLLSIHDLRIVPGTTHTNVVFDCARPHGCKAAPELICRTLRERVRMQFPDHFCVITVDDSFTALPDGDS